jgi:hypothetical protein
MGKIREASPRFQARMAGIFAWISTTEGVALLVRSRLVVDSDATATAHNILAHELLYRSAIVGDVIAYVVSILYTLLLYNLFRLVSRRLSLVAAVLSLVGLFYSPLYLRFSSRPFGRPWRRSVLKCSQRGPVASAGAHVSQLA